MSTTPQHQVERRIRAALTNLQGELQSVIQSLEKDDHPHIDGQITGIYFHALACKRFLTLYRPSRMETYEPAAVLRAVSGQQMPVRSDESESSELTAEGDKEQVAECARLLVESVQMLVGGGMQFALFQRQEDPHIAFRVSEGGRFPEKLLLAKAFEIPMREFMERWAAATSGGAVEWAADSVELYLAGDEPVPEPVEKFGLALKPVSRVARSLRAWGGAAGHHHDGLVSEEESQRLYKETTVRARDAVNEALRIIG